MSSAVLHPKRVPMKIGHLLQAWEERCGYCGKRIVGGLPNNAPDLATRDHFIPRRRKGSDGVENIVPACARCNNLKDGIDPRLFLMIWLRINPVGFFRTVEAVLRFERRKRVRPPSLDTLYPQTPANEP